MSIAAAQAPTKGNEKSLFGIATAAAEDSSTTRTFCGSSPSGEDGNCTDVASSFQKVIAKGHSPYADVSDCSSGNLQDCSSGGLQDTSADALQTQVATPPSRPRRVLNAKRKKEGHRGENIMAKAANSTEMVIMFPAENKLMEEPMIFDPPRPDVSSFSKNWKQETCRRGEQRNLGWIGDVQHLFASTTSSRTLLRTQTAKFARRARR